MHNMKTINYKQLEAADACSEQLQEFRNTFGDGEVSLTKENLLLALSVGLDVLFLERLLDWEDWLKYKEAVHPARVEYLKMIDPIGKKYEARVNTALAKYEKTISHENMASLTDSESHKVRGFAAAEYLKDSTSASDEYWAVREPAVAKYRAAAGPILLYFLTRKV